MADPVALQGRFVRLEPLSRHHTDGLLAAATGSRETYDFTWVPHDAATLHRYIEVALDEQQAGVGLPFTTCDAATGRVVGSTRFLDLEYWDDDDPTTPTACEIGATWLAASVQRTPVNTEAKLLMLTHAFDQWKVHRVTLKT